MAIQPTCYVTIKIEVAPVKYGMKLDKGEFPVAVNFMVLVSDEAYQKHTDFFGGYAIHYMSGTQKIDERVVWEDDNVYYGSLLSYKTVEKTFRAAVAEASRIIRTFNSDLTNIGNELVEVEERHVHELRNALDEVLESRMNLKDQRVLAAHIEANVKMVRSEERPIGRAVFPSLNVVYTIKKYTAAKLAETIADEYNLLVSVVTHPVSGEEMGLGNAIVNLNDEHQWSFDKIADWLDTLDIDTTICSRKDFQ